jgi:hypothetical protein
MYVEKSMTNKIIKKTQIKKNNRIDTKNNKIYMHIILNMI